MAVPPLFHHPSKISLLAWNTPSREPKPSRCAAATLVMMAASGLASDVVQAISPGWLAPQLHHRELVLRLEAQRGQRHPTSLLKLPAVASTSPGCRMAVAISFTVVLPQLPVMASTFGLMRSRTSLPDAQSPLRVLPTTSWNGRRQFALHQQGTGADGFPPGRRNRGRRNARPQAPRTAPRAQGTVSVLTAVILVVPDQTGIEHLRQGRQA